MGFLTNNIIKIENEGTVSLKQRNQLISITLDTLEHWNSCFVPAVTLGSFAKNDFFTWGSAFGGRGGGEICTLYQ